MWLQLQRVPIAFNKDLGKTLEKGKETENSDILKQASQVVNVVHADSYEDS